MKDGREFYFNNLSCCSVIFLWKDENSGNEDPNPYEYELYQNESIVYKGNDTYHKVINLNPKTLYTFKLRIIKGGNFLEEREPITIETKISPIAFLSKKSVDIANGEIINNINILSNIQKEIINNSCNLIFRENNEYIIKGNFDGIEMKIAHDKDKNIYYISFDINSNYFEKFFSIFIEECKNDIIVPCHFIIKKLPTILIFDLIKKGTVIFTGKRMGGVIASSLAFYIVCIGKPRNIIYENAFEKQGKDCIGVVTFGSPSFLINLVAADINKELTPYFYNIKAEFDYIPEIIDFLNKDHKYKDIINIIEKIELDLNDITSLNNYLKKNNFTKDNLKNKLNKPNKIPFGIYYMKKEADNNLIAIDEDNFEKFYYFKYFQPNKSIFDLKKYKNLSSNINHNFNKEDLSYLENDDINYLESIRIIRRNNKNSNSIKGIIKFKLIKNNDQIFTPDIIKQIQLISNINDKFNIYNKDIYYDNDSDITAYINDLNNNIDKIIIINNFGGKMTSEKKNIINIQGSGSTRQMLEQSIEKLFLFPFFKLFEIFYISLNNKEIYNELKEKNFGNDFSIDNIKILKPFKNQIEILDELLFFCRPDILGKYENKIKEEYIGNKFNETQKNCLNNKKLKNFYEKALKAQNDMNIPCLDSELNSVAKRENFPAIIREKKEIQKLFMCNSNFNSDDFISERPDDLYIKTFFLEELIKRILQKIEDVYLDLNIENNDELKKVLNEKMIEFYNEEVIPNTYFIFILILSSIESGDKIKFNHNLDSNKISKYSHWTLSFPITLLFKNRGRINYEKDFEKIYKTNQIEAIHMKNLFNKTKMKNIVNSNISSENTGDNLSNNYDYFIPFIFNINDIIQINENKCYNFSEYSEKQIYGKDYYEKFLELFRNNSNDFLEDIELSIYENLRKENKNHTKIFLTIKEMINSIIDDEESKKGFLALLRQSFLLGKLRSNLVSIYFNYIFL